MLVNESKPALSAENDDNEIRNNRSEIALYPVKISRPHDEASNMNILLILLAFSALKLIASDRMTPFTRCNNFHD